MKQYSDLPHSIQILIENHCADFLLNPHSQYNAILSLLKAEQPEAVAKHLKMSFSLIELIDGNNDQHKSAA